MEDVPPAHISVWWGGGEGLCTAQRTRHHHSRAVATAQTVNLPPFSSRRIPPHSPFQPPTLGISGYTRTLRMCGRAKPALARVMGEGEKGGGEEEGSNLPALCTRASRPGKPKLSPRSPHPPPLWCIPWHCHVLSILRHRRQDSTWIISWLRGLPAGSCGRKNFELVSYDRIPPSRSAAGQVTCQRTKSATLLLTAMCCISRLLLWQASPPL